jgi:hypothetical protein
MATLYKTNGETIQVSPKEGSTFTLEELQGYVEGYIQLVPTQSGDYIVVNEEGILYNLPFNSNASSEFQMGLVGNVLLCSPSEMN